MPKEWWRRVNNAQYLSEEPSEKFEAPNYVGTSSKSKDRPARGSSLPWTPIDGCFRLASDWTILRPSPLQALLSSHSYLPTTSPCATRTHPRLEQPLHTYQRPRALRITPHTTPLQTWQRELLPSSSCLLVMAVLERLVRTQQRRLYRLATWAAREMMEHRKLTRYHTDHIRQAPLDWRVRKEIHRDPRCRSAPTWFHHRKLARQKESEGGY